MSAEMKVSVLTWEKDNLIEKLSEANSHSLKLQDTVNTHATRLRDGEKCSAQLKVCTCMLIKVQYLIEIVFTLFTDVIGTANSSGQ